MEIVKRCEQITLDFERSKFETLSVKDKLQLSMHLAMCSKCRRFAKDSQKLDIWLRRRIELANQEFHFTSEEKETIKAKLG